MTHNPETLDGLLRNTKPLRRLPGPMSKPRKHRYERRKLKHALRHGDWTEEDRL